MQRVTASQDTENAFEVDLKACGKDEVVKEFSTDIIILWSTCDPKLSLNERYELLRIKLADRWGVLNVSKATAYQVLEVAVRIVNSLKKTHSDLPN